MEEWLDLLQWFVLLLQGCPGPMGMNGLGLMVDASYHANTSVVTHWKKRKTH